MPHLRAEVLRGVGAWDPYNVTEDADLGIRLARFGYRTATITSTTWEEAPADLDNWFRQRTRWLKGWAQTWIVHARQPARLWRELGPRGFLGLQMLMAGILLAVLVHPLVYGLVGLAWWQGRLFTAPETQTDLALRWVAGTNFTLGLVSTIVVGALACLRRGWRRLAWAALAMPLYWLMISLAGYRSLWHLLRKPHFWEKTRHGGGG